MTDRSAPTVLVVEDEAVVALDITASLRRLGYGVVGSCPTAEEAVEIVGRERPDLILMDIRLRGAMDGIEAGGQISRTWRLPVVYLTAHADAETLERAKETAPYGYLLKPFDEQKLRVALELALAKHHREQERERHRRDLLAVLDILPIGTALIDRNGSLAFANAAARRMLELEEEAVGRPWTDVVPFGSTTVDAVRQQREREPGRRSRVGAALGDPPTRAVEIEVVDDPRADSGTILLLHDVSEVQALRAELDGAAEFENMIGRSPGMKRVFQLIRELATVDSSVLVHGETGTGKELVARALHRLSRRADGPFTAVNCGGLSDELAMSQLFGHAKGSFTGAIEDRQGYFEAADGGVLFLDEIGELSERVQSGLLRALEEGEIVRIGENEPRPVDVRLLVATHRNLDEEMRENRFRADLYYRIRVAQIDLPPLRHRKEDIPPLSELFLAHASAVTRKEVESIEPAALSLLLEYHWPGNVRELRNAIEFAVIRSTSGQLAAADLPAELANAGLDVLHGATEAERIRAALVRTRGQRKRAAELLGMSRATFYRRLKEYDIETS